MRIRVRQVTTAKELALIIKLDELCFPLDDRIDVSTGTWWISWHDDLPVGYAGLKEAGVQLDHRGKNPARTVFMARCGVIGMYQGLGLQRRLAAVRTKYARKLGVRRAITYTAFENIASQRNLVKEGFLPYRPHHNWGGMRDALYWMLEL